MKVGDLVTYRTLLEAMVPLIVGVVVEVGLWDVDDTGLEYEEKAVIRICWSEGGESLHFEEEMGVING